MSRWMRAFSSGTDVPTQIPYPITTSTSRKTDTCQLSSLPFGFFLPIAVQRKEDRADPDQHDNRKQPQRVDSVAPHGGPQDFFICQCTDHGWPPPAARVHTARSEYTMVRRASMSGSRLLRAKCTNRRHTEVCRRFFCPACAPVLSRTPAGRRKKLRTRRCAVCRYANRLSTSGAVAAAWACTRRQRHRRG